MLSRIFQLVGAGVLIFSCVIGCGRYRELWNSSSTRPVATYAGPTLAERSADLKIDPACGYRFAVFGDQRNLADGEWQRIMGDIAELSKTDSLLFMLDTGDFVQNGKHTDQFWDVQSILRIVPELPYLITIGNHETQYNLNYDARVNTATFFRYLDREITANRLYYSMEVGPVLYLFLDSNDFAYGDDGLGRLNEQVLPGSRGEAQLKWLVDLLNSDHRGPDATTIAAIHHPFVQTSVKHREQALKLWDLEYEGRTLPDILLDGGVDLVLSGHVHTYELFRMERSDKRVMYLANLSGRPRNNRFFIGKGSRRPKSIANHEQAWLKSNGWSGLENWEIVQEAVAGDDNENQFGIVTVEPDGGLLLETCFAHGDAASDLRHTSPVRLK